MLNHDGNPSGDLAVCQFFFVKPQIPHTKWFVDNRIIILLCLWLQLDHASVQILCLKHWHENTVYDFCDRWLRTPAGIKGIIKMIPVLALGDGVDHSLDQLGVSTPKPIDSLFVVANPVAFLHEL